MNYKQIPIDDPILKQIGIYADEIGTNVYVVGGYVRDYFLGRPRTDIDCTVEGDAIAFAEYIAKKFNTKAVIYERFRTALVPIGKLHIEFVGTRKEEYLPDSRKPIVKEGTLYDDLARRDFTVNAMAASINSKTMGQIIDLFGGVDDLHEKILRTPKEPAITYSDDPLRMMRAARFASQLGFRLEDNSFYAIQSMADRIKIISGERIADELMKIMKSPQPSIGFYLLYDTGLLPIFFQELSNLSGVEIVTEGDKRYGHKDVFRHSLKVLDNICNNTENVWLRFAALLHDVGKPRTKRFSDTNGWTFHGHEEVGARMAEKIFKRLKLPLEHLFYIQKLIRMHQRPMRLVDEEVTDSAVRRLAFQAGSELEDLFTLCRSDITTKNPNLSSQYLKNYDLVAEKVLYVQEKDRLRDFQSPVRGEEIIEICNIPPSKPVGYIKSKIEDAILDGIIPNEYEASKAYFLENMQLWLDECKDPNQIQVHRRG